jgi:hypothetical protein
MTGWLSFVRLYLRSVGVTALAVAVIACGGGSGSPTASSASSPATPPVASLFVDTPTASAENVAYRTNHRFSFQLRETPSRSELIVNPIPMPRGLLADAIGQKPAPPLALSRVRLYRQDMYQPLSR